jgi:hypothetical protein
MSDDKSVIRDQLTRLLEEVGPARTAELEAHVTHRNRVNEVTLGSEYGAQARGRTKVLQAERDAWVEDQTQQEYYEWQRARAVRLTTVDRIKALVTMLESLQDDS